MAKIYLSSIAAMARNNAIGKDNALLWHIPEDFAYFKKTTLGKPVIMGRKTYESLGKPLPGRPNIVISRSFLPPINDDGPFFVKTIDEALALAALKAKNLKAGEIFIIGGGEIYKQTLPLTDRLYLTLIDREYEGDTFFPDFDWSDWTIISQDKRPENPERNAPAFTFYVLERK